MKVFYITGVFVIYVTSGFATVLPPPFPYPNNPPLIPGCPIIVYDHSLDCHPPCFNYSVDPPKDLCSEGQICCNNQCGYETCVDPIYEGECILDGQPCLEYNCTVDGVYDCIGNEICCGSFDCPFCAVPLYFRPVCPPIVFNPNENPCYKRCHDDYQKDVCTDGEICCPRQCGEECVKPDYYRVLCPNESILEAEEPWQRQTSFCLENCDCQFYSQICCESPCGCELDICRYPVIQKAVCPQNCIYDYWKHYDCSFENYCNDVGQICCSTCGGPPTCQNPEFVQGPEYLWEIGITDVPEDYYD